MKSGEEPTVFKVTDPIPGPVDESDPSINNEDVPNSDYPGSNE